MLKETKKISDLMWFFTGMLILEVILTFVLTLIDGSKFNIHLVFDNLLIIFSLWLGYYIAYGHFNNK